MSSQACTTYLFQWNRHLCDKMLIDRLEWCGLLVDYCDVFISCLDSHSDGTHSLQRIHWWMDHSSDEETNSSISWMAWGWVNFQQIFSFGWTIPLKCEKTLNIALVTTFSRTYFECWRVSGMYCIYVYVH